MTTNNQTDDKYNDDYWILQRAEMMKELLLDYAVKNENPPPEGTLLRRALELFTEGGDDEKA